jgi:hypothetical protein
MSQLSPIFASSRNQLVLGLRNTAIIGIMIVAVSTAAVVTWLARQSGNQALINYVVFGVPVMAMSNGLIFGVGWSLSNDIRFGIMEFSLISRTSLLSISIGKTIGQLVASAIGGVLSLTTVLLVARGMVHVPDMGIVLLSLPMLFVALVMTSLFFAPWTVLMGARGGFFNIFMPLVAVLSGYAFPVSQLPPVLRVLSWFLPGSWATSGLWQSVQWTGQWGSFLLNEAMCILVCGAWWFLVRWMFTTVEHRVRIAGTVGTY